MRCPPLAKSSSSDDSDALDTKSCFDSDDKEGETDANTNPTDIDTDVEGEDELDVSWIIDRDKDHSLDYYLNQEEEFDEAEDANEDYKDNSIVLLDEIEERWYW
jgi:hypothetical protein